MEAIFIKFNKKSIFQNFISLNLELRTVKQRHPYFHPSRTPPHHFRPPTNCRGLLSKPNQDKNHHFVICRTLTSYLSLNFIITNNHTEFQSPRGRRFCLLSWSTFYGELSRVTPNADAFSGVLRLAHNEEFAVKL